MASSQRPARACYLALASFALAVRSTPERIVRRSPAKVGLARVAGDPLTSRRRRFRSVAPGCQGGPRESRREFLHHLRRENEPRFWLPPEIINLSDGGGGARRGGGRGGGGGVKPTEGNKPSYVVRSNVPKRGDLLLRGTSKNSTLNRPPCSDFASVAMIDGREISHPEYLSQSVILVASNDQRGSVGFMLNRFTQFKLGEILRVGELSEYFGQSMVLLGGDNGDATLTVLHNNPNIKGSLQLRPGVMLGGEKDSIFQAVKSGQSHASDFTWILGQSTWPAGQLSSEVSSGTWLSVAASDNFIHPRSETPVAFLRHANSLWQRIMSELNNTEL